MNERQPAENSSGCCRTDGAEGGGAERWKNMLTGMILCMLAVSWVTGRGILRILYGEKREAFCQADFFLTGWVALIGMAQASHLLAVFGRLSLQACTFLLGGAVICLTLAMGAVSFFAGRRGEGAPGEAAPERAWKKRLLPVLLPALVFLTQAVFLLTQSGACLTGDMTLETVTSFLDTDGIYQVNPLTGAPYESGIPFRLKILCLPTFYSVLCRVFSAPPQTTVWQAVPCVTLVLSYGAFFCVGKALFPESRKRQACFLTVAALLLWAGSYAPGMDGFGLLYQGWRGETIRNAVLLPYLLSLCLRGKWKSVLLCIAAEACVVWTLYGAGACLFVAAGLAVSRQVWDRRKKQTEKE